MKSLLAFLTLSCSLSLAAEEPARVLLFGTFHFQDAGRDLVKVDDVDVFSEDSQRYLEALTDRLAAFEPTAVLLEYNPESEEAINERYRAYREGTFELPANEVYQLGFRIAARAGLERVNSFDHRAVQWNIEPVFEMAKDGTVPEVTALQEAIAHFQADEQQFRATAGLQQMLARNNDPSRDALNMGSYLMTNAVGAGRVSRAPTPRPVGGIGISACMP